jgi:osmoprotectant transport system substrate-binding protein
MNPRSRRWKVAAALLAACTLFAAACGDDDDDAERSGPRILVGAQDFGESAILAEIYAQVLDDAGYEVDEVSVGGFRDLLLGAFDSGEVNFSPEYAASLLEFLNGQAGEATGDVDETVGKLRPLLTERGLVALAPSSAVDTNSFVVTRETAEEHGLEKLSDLAGKESQLTLGGPQDCETNPFCIPGLREVYDVDLSGNFVPLDAGLVATALAGGEIDVAVLFSTDGRIAEEGWVLLEDDRSMLAADNVVPVLAQALIDAYGDELVELVDSVSAKLTTEALIELNRRYDVDKDDADDIAEDWIRENL